MKYANLNSNHIPFKESFENPSSLYRGAPFWSWNGDLKKEEVLRQIDIFDEMGIGGYHIHPRTGMTTEYLGEEYMDLVKACLEHGREKGMLTWLYDEDRWPSGFAGGLVTKDKELRVHSLLITTSPYGTGEKSFCDDSRASGCRSENGYLLRTFAVSLKDKYLDSYRIIKEGQDVREGEVIWYVYVETAPDSSWFNNQAYVDTLNPSAIKKFIEITHEKYKEVVGDSFGSDIPAIFTDEPQFAHKKFLKSAGSTEDTVFPWTPDLEEAFSKQYGESIANFLPELLWDLPDKKVSVWRYRYHDWIAERFAFSFADQIGQWCEKNKLALTGHMMEEPSLASQTNALGDAMRSYRSFQIPGIDMLCDRIELSTAKQAQSAARQYGRPGLLSELYGVTGWHFDFKGHKRQGDWQAALGVLFRVHHLTWYSMRGEAKRDYPASIGYQSPWYKEYKNVEDHFARVGATLSRGKAVCNVAVIHPIESYWICAGPHDTSSIERQEREKSFAGLHHWLLYGGIDFDFVAESLLDSQADSDDPKTFGVGEMDYEVLLVPSMKTIRSTTMGRLEKFAGNGGRIIFAGEVPTLVDAEISNRAQELASSSHRMQLGERELLKALDRHRTVSFLRFDGHNTASLLYQMREEGRERYLFICNSNKEMENGEEVFTLCIKGEWQILSLDTSSAGVKSIAANYEDGNTKTNVRLEAAGHLLLHLIPGQQTNGESLEGGNLEEVSSLSEPVSVTLDEPNVLLFDKAVFSINDGEWQSEEQLLTIENILRSEIDLLPKSGRIAQPWTDTSPVVKLADISLKLNFKSEVSCRGVQLALENLAESEIVFDGEKVDTSPLGFFTDKSIETVSLPDFEPGEHCVEIALAFTKETSIEWMYLLGDFGVQICGSHGKIVEPVRNLSFGDWTTQGLPFYGGNVTYHCMVPKMESDKTGSVLQILDFEATTIKVISQEEKRMISYPPYNVEIPMKQGEKIDLKVFGHRANCFGPIHLSDPSVTWLGPDAYRSKGDSFSEEFILKPLGIMAPPIIFD